MFSRPLAVAVFALLGVTAAGAGVFVASHGARTRADSAVVTPVPAAVRPPVHAAAPRTGAGPSTPPPAVSKAGAPAAALRRGEATRPLSPHQAPSADPVLPPSAPLDPPPASTASNDAVRPVDPPSAPSIPPTPQFDEVVVPAAAVMGLQVGTALSSERSQVEDRVDARVTRDVMIGGRVAIPVGSRVVGSVVAVTRGGRIKEPAHLVIRFHTLVLPDGTEMELRTDPIERFGQSQGTDSGRKIGGAAIAGAILGGILGGGKGAAIGATAGGAAGTAAAMSGDRDAATVAAGALLNVRLTDPITIQIERR